MELEGSTFLTLVYKAKVIRQQSTGTKTDMQTNGRVWKAQR